MRNLVIRHTVGFAAALALAGVPAAVTASVVSSTGAGATTCVAGFSDAGGGWCSADFAATGAPTTVTLPMGANFQVRIDASGAEGGWSREDGIGEASHGGLGGRQTGTVLRPGGTTFTIVVGQQGGMVSGASWVPGGFGGGGAPSSIYGGGGGGGSFVFDGAGPIVVAGGGGGGGWDANPTWCANPANQESPGGAGAGAVGPAGTGTSVAFACDPTFHAPAHFAPGGGVGATATGAGAGGVPGTPSNNLFGQTPGGSGSGPAVDAANVGVGGVGGGTDGGSGCYSTWAGGGGGGYYGGGGGGDIPCDLEGGGGGGGVGFVGIGATNTVSQTGVRSGDGIVTLAYHDVPALSATNTVLSGPTSGKAGRPRVFKVAVSVMQNGTASGSVSLYDGSTVVATATLAKGKAKLSATFAKGVHTLVAYYGGDATRAPSTSATLSITIK